jgi:hypothetical protein
MLRTGRGPAMTMRMIITGTTIVTTTTITGMATAMAIAGRSFAP